MRLALQKISIIFVLLIFSIPSLALIGATIFEVGYSDFRLDFKALKFLVFLYLPWLMLAIMSIAWVLSFKFHWSIPVFSSMSALPGFFIASISVFGLVLILPLFILAIVVVGYHLGFFQDE